MPRSAGQQARRERQGRGVPLTRREGAAKRCCSCVSDQNNVRTPVPMVDLRKLLARDARRNSDHNTDADSALPSGDGLEAEYETLIVAQCRRYGIADSTITIEVRQIGRAPDGRDVYQGMIRLARWERDSAL